MEHGTHTGGAEDLLGPAREEVGRPPAQRGRRERWLAWALALGLLAPSAVWIARDRSVWSWDPASYATESVDLWFTLAHEPHRWFQRMRTVFPAKAPGTAWLGQLFVPPGRLAGSVELGLLGSVLLTQLAALLLTFRLGRSLAPGSVLPAVAGTLFVAASPMFVAVSHHFLTEPLQLLSIVYLLWVAAEAPSAPPVRMALHLVLAASLGVVAKFATPAFVLFPGLLATVRIGRRLLRPPGRLAFGRKELALALVALVVLVLGGAWYAKNGGQVYEFAKLAASGDVALDYGSRGTVATKLRYWLGAMSRTLATPWVAGLLVTAGVVAGIRAAARRGGPGGKEGREALALAAAAVLQLAFVTYVLVRSINEETRYLLALAPTLAVLLVFGAARARSRLVPALLAALLASQWAVVNARQLGLTPADGATVWERPPEAAGPLVRELSELERATCRREDGGKRAMIGMDVDWLNYCTLTFYSSKARLTRGFRCTYEYLGHAQKDPEAGFRIMRAFQSPFFVSLAEAAMPKPPDFLNQAALEVLRRVEGDPRFARVSFESRNGVLVFERLGGW